MSGGDEPPSARRAGGEAPAQSIGVKPCKAPCDKYANHIWACKGLKWLLLAPALMKQKSADQTRTDNKTNSTWKLSPSSLEKIKMNMVDCINSCWGSGRVATGSSGQPKAHKEELRVLTKDAQTWLSTLPAPPPGTGSHKSCLQVIGMWVLLGSAGWSRKSHHMAQGPEEHAL